MGDAPWHVSTKKIQIETVACKTDDRSFLSNLKNHSPFETEGLET